jgi:hypothetical protein
VKSRPMADMPLLRISMRRRNREKNKDMKSLAFNSFSSGTQEQIQTLYKKIMRSRRGFLTSE